MTYELLNLTIVKNELTEVVGGSIVVKVTNDDDREYIRGYQLTYDELVLVVSDEETNLPPIVERECAIARKEQEDLIAAEPVSSPQISGEITTPTVDIDPAEVQDIYDNL